MTDDSSLDSTLRGLVAGERVFGRYLLEKVLGKGGMGIVWLARDEALEKNVALKFIVESLARDAEAVANLKRETRRCQDLHHPGIVGIYDLQQDADRVAVSMEYVEGNTLSATKAEQRGMCFAPEEIFEWMEQLATVLGYAHAEARIVHRDLKPANLMLGKNGRIKVMDFGIAHQLNDSQATRGVGQPKGYTATFASPQQIMGERASAADDVYSFGATIYDLITGKPPFYSGQIEMQALQLTPPPMAERRAEFGHPAVEIPTEWESVVAACLAKDAAERPANVAEVVRALRTGLQKSDVPEKVAPSMPEAEVGRTKTYHAMATSAGVVAPVKKADSIDQDRRKPTKDATTPTLAVRPAPMCEIPAPEVARREIVASKRSSGPASVEPKAGADWENEEFREDSPGVVWQMLGWLQKLAIVLLVAAGTAWVLHLVRTPELRAQFRPETANPASNVAEVRAAPIGTGPAASTPTPARAAPATPRGILDGQSLQGANSLGAKGLQPTAAPRGPAVPLPGK